MTKPLTELFESKVAFDRKTLLEAEKRAFTQHFHDYVNAYIQFGGDPELRNSWFHGVGFDTGAEKEAGRRKPIDLATKKLIEALETVLMQCISVGAPNSFNANTARKALAEFRASLEDGE